MCSALVFTSIRCDSNMHEAGDLARPLAPSCRTRRRSHLAKRLMKPPFQPPKIPQYIWDLNDLAALHGIATSIVFAPHGSNADIRLWAKWKGTCQHLQSIGLLARHKLARLIRSWRRPSLVRRFRLTVPSSEPPWCNPLLRGEIEVSGDHFEWNLDFGPANFSVVTRRDVEAIKYPDEIWLYGSADALIHAGVDETRLPLGKRTAKSSPHDAPKWHSRRVPNGLYLYRYATGASSQIRHAHKPGASTQLVRPQLRLVVDNTFHDRTCCTRLPDRGR